MDLIGASRRVRAASPLRSVASGSDDDLMGWIREGDRRSLGTLLDRFWSPLNSYAAGILEDPEGAQDVVQEVFIQVWRKRTAWSPTGSVAAYLYRITRNLSLNARRDGRLRQERHEEGRESHVDDVSPRTPEQQLEASALQVEINAAIARLPDRQGEVFRLSRFHGLSHREIAEALGSSQQTVANQMSAALSGLRDALSHHLHEQ